MFDTSVESVGTPRLSDVDLYGEQCVVLNVILTSHHDLQSCSSLLLQKSSTILQYFIEDAKSAGYYGDLTKVEIVHYGANSLSPTSVPTSSPTLSYGGQFTLDLENLLEMVMIILMLYLLSALFYTIHQRRQLKVRKVTELSRALYGSIPEEENISEINLKHLIEINPVFELEDSK